MAGFLAKPAVDLVGAGMQAIGVGIPVGESSARIINSLRSMGAPVPPESWFKVRGSQEEIVQASRSDAGSRTPTIYDTLESHVHGVMQVVRPIIELQKMVQEGTRSVDRPAPRKAASNLQASYPAATNTFNYYTPQKPSSGACLQTPSSDKLHTSQKNPAKGSESKKEHFQSRCLEASFDDDEYRCVYCSSTKVLIKLPCGRFICAKCDKDVNHGKRYIIDYVD